MRSSIKRLRSLIKEALSEARTHVSAEEVLASWEDLYMNSLQNNRKGDIEGLEPGVVSLEELSSWLGAPESVVAAALQRSGLMLDPRTQNVVERGLSVPPSK